EILKNLTRLLSRLEFTWVEDNPLLKRLVSCGIGRGLRNVTGELEVSTGDMSQSLYRLIVDCATGGRLSSEARDAATAFTTFESFIQPMLAASLPGTLPTPKVSVVQPPTTKAEDRRPHPHIRLPKGPVH